MSAEGRLKDMQKHQNDAADSGAPETDEMPLKSDIGDVTDEPSHRHLVRLLKRDLHSVTNFQTAKDKQVYTNVNLKVFTNS
jgi:hypothetical protein